MAIKPGYKTFTFDGQNSGTYGAYITGSAVYNAPERDVELIKIPGRDGAFVKDNGRFENIEVEYPAGIYAESQEDFAQALSDLRNMLASRKGYCRLTDEYNPEEYRMAVYKSGLDVDPVAFQRAGEFKIVFECKPQRWLTSGEAKQTIASSGDTITNPTLFDARPMVEATGYGDLTVNGHKVTLENEEYGTIQLLPTIQLSTDGGQSTVSKVSTFDNNLVAVGDTITLNSQTWSAGQTYYGSVSCSKSFISDRAYTVGTITTTATNISYYLASTNIGRVDGSLIALSNPITFTAGTASTVSSSLVAQYPMYNSSNVLVETAELSLTLTIAYDGNNTITVTATQAINNDSLNIWSFDTDRNFSCKRSKVIADSTASMLGHPTYIDCDLGICYKIENGSVIDLNRYIDLGSEMPFLKPGSNMITFDNTFTKIQIVPRWWKV